MKKLSIEELEKENERLKTILYSINININNSNFNYIEQMEFVLNVIEHLTREFNGPPTP